MTDHSTANVTSSKNASVHKKTVGIRRVAKLQQAGKLLQETGPKPATRLQQFAKLQEALKLLQAATPKPVNRIKPSSRIKPAITIQPASWMLPPIKRASVLDEKPLDAARRAKARRELGGLDYIRNVRVAVEELGQAEVARVLRVSQPSVSKLLSGAEARGVKPVPDGFSGAGPYEIAERYAAGDIDRDAVIRELTAWPYARNEGAAAAAAEWESTPYLDTPGSFAEVGRAFDEGLIDGDAYDLILDSVDDAIEHLG